MSNQIAPPMKAKGVVHKMVADTAKGCAEVRVGEAGQAEPLLQGVARQGGLRARSTGPTTSRSPAILIGMLGNPKYTQSMKDEIFDAVLRDGAVNPKKMAEPAKPSFFLGQKT
jgi:hypothetical protein